jgi:hypothetical protein
VAKKNLDPGVSGSGRTRGRTAGGGGMVYAWEPPRRRRGKAGTARSLPHRTAPHRVASPRPPPKTSPIPSGPNPNPFPPTPLHPLRPLLFVSKVYPLSATNPPQTGRCRWLLSERRWWWSSRRCRSASGSTPRTRSWCGTTSSARSPARSTPRPRSSPRSTSASASRGISQVPDDLVCVCFFFSRSFD